MSNPFDSPDEAAIDDLDVDLGRMVMRGTISAAGASAFLAILTSLTCFFPFLSVLGNVLSLLALSGGLFAVYRYATMDPTFRRAAPAWMPVMAFALAGVGVLLGGLLTLLYCWQNVLFGLISVRL